MTLLGQLLLVLIVAGFVLAPLVLYRGQRTRVESREESFVRSIAERKGRLYQTILELDFDRDSGKISVEDHARMREEAMKDVLEVLKEEQTLAPAASAPAATHPLDAPAGAGMDRVEALIAEYKRTSGDRAEAIRP